MMTAMMRENQQRTINHSQCGKIQQNKIYDTREQVLNFEKIISLQATINIGLVGHVSHGKSTIVQAITGVKTAKYKDQIRDNHTKRLGFANAKIYKCSYCQPPGCYKSYPSDKQDNPKCSNAGCEQQMKLMRHVSFCDCPGHDKFMSTMLTGASILDAAMLTIAADVQCPQPQTAQHANALQMLNIKNNIVLQNKIDLTFHNRDQVRLNYKQIKNFISGNDILKKSPIIPISAQLQYNIDALLQTICQLPEPQRLLNVPPILNIIRSFDVNKPGTDVQDMKGGVVGGTLIQGILKVGMEVQLRPGYVSRNKDGEQTYTPIKTKIVSLLAENNNLTYAIPGGLIGVGLLVDPSLTKNNKMVGNILGKIGELPELFSEITIKYSILKKLLKVGDKQDEIQKVKIQKMKPNQQLRINVKSSECEGRVKKIIDDEILVISLSRPVCAQIGDKAAFRRKINSKFRLIGYGDIKSGKIVERNQND